MLKVLLQKVAQQFELLQDESWKEIDASQKVQTIHKQVLETTERIIELVKMQPVGTLWKDE